MKILSGGLPLRLRARLRGELPGITLRHAHNAAEFWKSLKDEPFNAILVDQRIMTTSPEDFLSRRALPANVLTLFIARKGLKAEALRSILKPGANISIMHAPVRPDDLLKVLTLELGLSRSQLTGGQAPSGQPAVEKVWSEQQHVILARLESLERLAKHLGETDDRELKLALESARRLMGDLGSFGIYQANVVSRTIFHIITNALAGDPLDRKQLLRLTAGLRHLMERGLTPASSRLPTLLLASSDTSLGQALLGEARLLGWDLTHYSSLAQLVTAADGPHIQALLIDANSAELLIDKGSYEDLIHDPLPSFVIHHQPVPGVGRNHFWLNSQQTPYQMLMAVARVQLGPLALKPTNILHWDEDTVTRELARELLMQSDLSVKSVTHTFEFWKAMDEETPDLVLVSLHLPQMNGLEICRAIRLDERFGHLPVILLSEYSDSLSQLHAYESGVDDVIFKPFSPRELLSRVSNRLALSRLRRGLVDLSPVPSRLFSRLDQLLLRAHRQCVPLQLTWLKLVEGNSEADEDSLRQCQLTLRQSLRSDDLIRRMDSRSLLVACLVTANHNTRERIVHIVQAAFPQVKASWATYPDDADDLLQLMHLLQEKLAPTES